MIFKVIKTPSLLVLIAFLGLSVACLAGCIQRQPTPPPPKPVAVAPSPKPQAKDPIESITTFDQFVQYLEAGEGYYEPSPSIKTLNSNLTVEAMIDKPHLLFIGASHGHALLQKLAKIKHPTVDRLRVYVSTATIDEYGNRDEDGSVFALNFNMVEASKISDFDYVDPVRLLNFAKWQPQSKLAHKIGVAFCKQNDHLQRAKSFCNEVGLAAVQAGVLTSP